MILGRHNHPRTTTTMATGDHEAAEATPSKSIRGPFERCVAPAYVCVCVGTVTGARVCARTCTSSSKDCGGNRTLETGDTPRKKRGTVAGPTTDLRGARTSGRTQHFHYRSAPSRASIKGPHGRTREAETVALGFRVSGNLQLQ